MPPDVAAMVRSAAEALGCEPYTGRSRRRRSQNANPLAQACVLLRSRGSVALTTLRKRRGLVGSAAGESGGRTLFGGLFRMAIGLVLPAIAGLAAPAFVEEPSRAPGEIIRRLSALPAVRFGQGGMGLPRRPASFEHPPLLLRSPSRAALANPCPTLRGSRRTSKGEGGHAASGGHTSKQNALVLRVAVPEGWGYDMLRTGVAARPRSALPRAAPAAISAPGGSTTTFW